MYSIHKTVSTKYFLMRPKHAKVRTTGIKHPSGPQDQIFITVKQLRVCRCGALSLTRGRVCRLQLLLGLASAVIVGFESRVTHDHIVTCKSIARQRLQHTQKVQYAIMEQRGYAT
jgi:hypothetical protein